MHTDTCMCAHEYARTHTHKSIICTYINMYMYNIGIMVQYLVLLTVIYNAIVVDCSRWGISKATFVVNTSLLSLHGCHGMTIFKTPSSLLSRSKYCKLKMCTKCFETTVGEFCWSIVQVKVPCMTYVNQMNVRKF